MPLARRHPAIMIVMLSLLSACARPPEDAASSASPQGVPFDRQSHVAGISPSQSLIPSTTKLPEGTPISVRLQRALSSEWAHPGDTFSATVDRPVVVDGVTVVAEGTAATGRVLEARASAGAPGRSQEPGYLRIVLVSLNVGGRPVMIETSSIFAKGGSRDERGSTASPVSSASQKDKNIGFGADRHLSFRVAQTADLQEH